MTLPTVAEYRERSAVNFTTLVRIQFPVITHTPHYHWIQYRWADRPGAKVNYPPGVTGSQEDFNDGIFAIFDSDAKYEYLPHLLDVSDLLDQIDRQTSGSMNSEITVNVRNGLPINVGYPAGGGTTEEEVFDSVLDAFAVWSPVGQQITVFGFFGEQEAGVDVPAVCLFKGYVEEVIAINSRRVSIRCCSALAGDARKFVQKKLLPSEYPLAPPSEAGKVFPILYGYVKTTPCIRTEWPQPQTDNRGYLDGAIDADDTEITVKNVPPTSTGTAGFGEDSDEEKAFWIDSERITWATKNTVTFSGCVRGTAGTTAASHSDNADVREYPASRGGEAKVDVREALVTSGIDGIDPPYPTPTDPDTIWGEYGGLLAPITSVNVYIASDGGHETHGGQHCHITDTQLQVAEEILQQLQLVEPEQQQQITHAATNDGMSVFVSHVTVTERVFLFPLECPYVNPQNMFIYINWNFFADGPYQTPTGQHSTVFQFYQFAGNNPGWVTHGDAWVNQAGDRGRYMYAAVPYYQALPNGWDSLPTVSTPNGDMKGVSVRVLMNAGIRSGWGVSVDSCAIKLTGDLPLPLVDNSAYHYRRIYYSGWINTISRPDQVLNHFMQERLGMERRHPSDGGVYMGDMSRIHPASFDAAGARYDDTTGGKPAYNLSVAILEETPAEEVLWSIVRESRALLYDHKGYWRLLYLEDQAPTEGVIVVNKADLPTDTDFEFGYTNTVDVRNHLTIRYDKNHGPEDAPGATPFRKSLVVEDTALQAAPNRKQEGTIDLHYVIDDAMAQHLGEFFLLRLKRVYRTVRFEVFWTHDINIGDTIQIAGNEFWNDVKFLVTEVGRRGVERSTVSAVEWWYD